ncbi:hypothetical protein OIU79_031037 [Salix purpurea]|uniref:Uncharacterized protein n=1 Tax=Salix purpurea TaxID=77065 RepID=A0A9Q0ZS49_SALPP|nr:hypothetical protein OIU79_031037 [Salix purpurea]
MKLLLIFISILLIQAFVGNSFLGNAANSPANMDEESDVVAVDKKHYPKKISKFVVSGPPLAFHSRHSAVLIVVIYAQGDAGHRQERKYAIEPAKLAAKDAGVFHQKTPETKFYSNTKDLCPGLALLGRLIKVCINEGLNWKSFMCS